MGFLKKLFGTGGDSGRQSDRDGMYYYIRSKRTGEVIQVRLHRFNDLSPNEEYNGFYAHKTIVGSKSFDRIDAEFFFDRSRRLTSTELAGGELVERADYDDYLAQQSG